MKKLRWRVKWDKHEKTFKHFSDAYRLAETLRGANINAEIESVEADE